MNRRFPLLRVSASLLLAAALWPLGVGSFAQQESRPAFVIIERTATVGDESIQEQYAKLAREILPKYGARYLARSRVHSPIFAPIIALVLWTFVMCVWLYATRIPALSRHGIVYDRAKPNEAFIAQLPARVRWKSDNYNNLLEQPTLFYAVAVVLALSNAGDGVNLGLAWAYVAVRVAHSLVHALVNVVIFRFALFALGSAILFSLTVRAAFGVF